MNKIVISVIIIGLLLMPTIATATPLIVNNIPEENLHVKNNNYTLEKSDPPSVAEWTVMVYLDGDGGLEGFAIDKFLQMAQVGSTDDVNIIAQLDREPGLETRYDNWASTKRYRINQGMLPDNSSAIMDIGEANMADPQTLIDFVTWATNNYPANRYCLILLDHGGGWYGVCIDESSGSDILEMCELRTALSTVTNNGENPIDLICFDACEMAMLEVAYEIAPYALYMTASEWGITVSNVSYGIQYDETFACLTGNPSMPPETLGATFVSNFTDSTLSTLDLELINNLKDAVSDLGASLQVEGYFDEILNVLNEVQGCSQDVVDLYHLSQFLQNYIDDFEIDAKAQTIMDLINNTVTSEKHRPSVGDVHGITIYLVLKYLYRFWIYDPAYNDILYAQDSHWDEFLLWYIGLINTNPPEIPEITGPTSGEIGLLYDYIFETEDPDLDYVYFYVDWGDGTNSGWLGPYGCPCPYPHYLNRITLNHTWAEKGTYQVMVKAKDIFNLESDWATLAVTMPLDLPGSQHSSPTPQSQPSSQPSSIILQYKTSSTTNK